MFHSLSKIISNDTSAQAWYDSLIFQFSGKFVPVGSTNRIAQGLLQLDDDLKNQLPTKP